MTGCESADKELRILYIVGELALPITTSPRLQITSLLRFMSTRHECDVIAFTDYAVGEQTRRLRAYLPRVGSLSLWPQNRGVSLRLREVKGLAHLRPHAFARFDQESFASAIERSLNHRNYDLVHLYWFPAVGQYLPLCRGVPSIITLYDPYSLINSEATFEKSNIAAKGACWVSSMLYKHADKSYLPLAS